MFNWYAVIFQIKLWFFFLFWYTYHSLPCCLPSKYLFLARCVVFVCLFVFSCQRGIMDFKHYLWHHHVPVSVQYSHMHHFFCKIECFLVSAIYVAHTNDFHWNMHTLKKILPLVQKDTLNRFHILILIPSTWIFGFQQIFIP